MFIKKVQKTNGRSRKKYTYLHLVESVRTEQGPRQRLILNLGKLTIDASQYKALARRIEDILTGRQSFLKVDREIEKQAQEAAKKIFRKQAKEIEINQTCDFHYIDINSFDISQPRSLGSEYVCHSIWKELGFNEVLLSAGVSPGSLPLTEALVISRLIEPGSELAIKEWAETRSAIYELTGIPLRHSLSSYYRGTDILYSYKKKLEQHLSRKEKDLFSLKETMFFFDLTNSHFEGRCAKNKKAKFGVSKQKRNDCRLVTLGMIVDELGFAKYTEMFR